MFRRLAFVMILAGIGAAAAMAAPLPGKVHSTSADTLVVVVKLENVDWLVVGKPVRLMDADKGALVGKSTVIAIADSTVTVVAPKGKAKNLKPGSSVTMEKPKAGMSGC